MVELYLEGSVKTWLATAQPPRLRNMLGPSPMASKYHLHALTVMGPYAICQAGTEIGHWQCLCKGRKHCEQQRFDMHQNRISCVVAITKSCQVNWLLQLQPTDPLELPGMSASGQLPQQTQAPPTNSHQCLYCAAGVHAGRRARLCVTCFTVGCSSGSFCPTTRALHVFTECTEGTAAGCCESGEGAGCSESSERVQC